MQATTQALAQGKALLSRGKHALSLRAAAEVLQQHPRHAGALCLKGCSLATAGDRAGVSQMSALCQAGLLCK